MASDAVGEWIDAETKIVDAPADHHDPLRLWLRMFSASRIIEAEVRRRLLREFDITLPRFDLLSQLYRVEDGLALGEVSKRLMVSAGNITAIVDRLATEGHITRTQDPHDRRIWTIRMTATGRAYFTAMAAAHENWITEMLAELTSGDTKTLLALLGKVKASARAHVAEAAEG